MLDGINIKQHGQHSVITVRCVDMVLAGVMFKLC